MSRPTNVLRSILVAGLFCALPSLRDFTVRAILPNFSNQIRWVLLFGAIAWEMVTPGRAFCETAMNFDWIATAVSIQGDVQVLKKGGPSWQSIQLGDRFLPGDIIKVGKNSRAAFVLINESTLRVDQHSTLVFKSVEPKRPFLLELIKGAIHFFSRKHRRLRLDTPFVNGVVEGTEFYVRVEELQTTFLLFEGRLRVSNDTGTLTLMKNQNVTAGATQPLTPTTLIRPRDAVHWTLFYPAMINFTAADFLCDEGWCETARQSVDAWRKGDLRNAFKTLYRAPATVDDPLFLLYRAVLKLSVGQAESALADLQQVQSSQSHRSDALALLAVTALVQDQKEEAQRLMDQAASLAPKSCVVQMAASYVQQALFNLDGALAAAKSSTKIDPANALAWARLSELFFSVGDRKQALSAAKRAAILQPELAHTKTVLGFASLAQIKIDDAKRAFGQAIRIDSAYPMARLGLGLAKIRSGQLAEGRGDIEVAACLDPGNALIRSYLGKAYYEEKREDLASEQLAVAKKLDPADPTPWFYDAIRKQSTNRPVEALQELQKSIDLNDNRAVYRSRLMLDEDLAARSAGIGQIYRDLGFQQLALVQGWKSVNTDPTNYSAHRFLADSYSVLPRHEIARVSELLQSQLLQPLNVTPVQPSLAETDTFIIAGTEPSAPAFNEFSPLFVRNRLALQASGIVGSQSTWGDEIAQSGLWNRFSYSLGQFHHETKGFRENNDRSSSFYNAYGQISVTPDASLMAEYRYSEVEKGDLSLLFDPENISKNYRQETNRQSFRIGGKYSPNPHNDILGTAIVSQLEGTDSDFSDELNAGYVLSEDQNGGMIEAQHLYRSQKLNLISGVGYLHSDSDSTITPTPGSPNFSTSRVDHTTPYIYSQLRMPEQVIWTLGGSMDFYQSSAVEREQFNPKLGVTWNLTSETTLRAAAFRSFKRQLIADQTLEPTQVAGFNQFFDDGNRTDAWRYGGAIDQVLGRNLFAGLEYSIRDLEVSYKSISQNEETFNSAGWDERAGRGYLFWTPASWVSTSLEYNYAKFERDQQFVGSDNFTMLQTHQLPIGVNFFHPTGLFVRLKATYVEQNGDFVGRNDAFEKVFEEDSDDFWVADASIGYRLPKRLGIISLEAKNLFNESFHFQDTDPENPAIIPEQVILCKATLAF